MTCTHGIQSALTFTTGFFITCAPAPIGRGQSSLAAVERWRWSDRTKIMSVAVPSVWNGLEVCEQSLSLAAVCPEHLSNQDFGLMQSGPLGRQSDDMSNFVGVVFLIVCFRTPPSTPPAMMLLANCCVGWLVIHWHMECYSTSGSFCIARERSRNQF